MSGEMEGTLRVVADPVIRSFENGSVVLLRPEVPDWIRTTEAGAWIFEQLRANPRTARQVVEAVAEHYALPEELVRDSTLRLLEALVEQGYAVAGEASDGGDRPAPAALPRVEDLGLWQLWLHVTSRCNLRCRHCYYPVDASGRDLPLEIARRLFDEAAGAGIRQVILSGGEPMLHAEIGELVEAGRAASPRESPWMIKLLSNGTIPDPQLFDRVVGQVDDVQISIDGVDASAHDALRGAGSFARAIRAFQRLHDGQFKVRRGLAFTPTPGNLDRLGELAKLAPQLGADYIHLNHARPPADPENRRALRAEGFLDDDFARRAVAAFRRLSVDVIADRKDAKGVISRPLFIDASFGHTLPLIQALHLENCGAGVTTIAFDPDGVAFPCAALVDRADCSLGRFPERDLAEIRRAGTAWNRDVFSVRRDPVCSNCAYRHFCGGGCRAMGERPSQRDPSCAVLRGCYEEFFQYVARPGQDEFSRLAARAAEGRKCRVRAHGCTEA